MLMVLVLSLSAPHHVTQSVDNNGMRVTYGCCDLEYVDAGMAVGLPADGGRNMMKPETGQPCRVWFAEELREEATGEEESQTQETRVGQAMRRVTQLPAELSSHTWAPAPWRSARATGMCVSLP